MKRLYALLDLTLILLIYLNFQPLEVVSRYRDPELQVAYICLIIYICLIWTQLQILMFRHTFYSQWFGWLVKQIKDDNSRDQ